MTPEEALKHDQNVRRMQMEDDVKKMSKEKSGRASQKSKKAPLEPEEGSAGDAAPFPNDHTLQNMQV